MGKKKGLGWVWGEYADIKESNQQKFEYKTYFIRYSDNLNINV